ncbi:MAG: sulfatase-like hydrolase/transferase [Solirubrobacterales bacterium]
MARVTVPPQPAMMTESSIREPGSRRSAASVAGAGAFAVALLVALAAPSTFGGHSTARAQGSAPNVLVVMTDDQPYGSQEKMPFISGRSDFVRFTQAFDNNPLCCPSRATFLSGLFSHHTGVETNDAADLFDPSRSIFTAFDDAGYETALIGKYLNRYPFGLGPTYRPPGFDRWVVFRGRVGYYDYALVEDGTTVHYATDPSEYSTDVLADHMQGFIEGADEPFFALWTPYGPHGPYAAAPRHEDAFDGVPVDLPPNFNEVDENVHRFYSEQPSRRQSAIREITRQQWAALLSEDEAIERFFATLQDQGELDNTIVAFTTDNGYSLGSHRWLEKQCLFDECGHLPLMIKAPGIAGGAEDAVVSNVDLPTTLADLAGVSFPQTDGESLEPLLRDQATRLGRPVLLRGVRHSLGTKHPDFPPTAWGIRTRQWKYIRYRSGEVDMFNLTSDPFERRDLADEARWAQQRRQLDSKLRDMK